jgi:DNA polymerase-3 subunit epsilon
MKRLYYDTETTGFPAKGGAPLSDQPHIVQLAAILVDDEEGEVASMNTIIKPDGWTVPEDAAAIHGISTEKAERFGVPITSAMSLFSQLCRQADQAIAHNDEFDLKLVTYEIERLGKPNVLLSTPRFCTMKATTDICKLPGRYGQFKWPKLIEAHQHFFSEGFDGAHDALVDVRACHRVHMHLIKNNLI